MSATPFVLDFSGLCGWFLANQTSPYCDAVAGLLPVTEAHEIVDQVAPLPIRIDTAPPPTSHPAEPGAALPAHQH